jgi:hypothetical protein
VKRSPSRAAGASLALLGVAMNVPFALLAANFGYPDILRRPAGEVLTRFHAAGAPLVLTWYAYVAAALLLVITALLAARGGGRPGPARASAIFGVLAGVFQVLGLLRWVFLVPYLAGVYADSAASPAAKETAGIVFDAFHRYAGVAVGEHLGQLFTALWAGCLAASLPHPWLRRAGIAIAAALGVGLVEGFATVLPFSPGPLAAVTPLAYVALSVWMVAVGVTLLIRPYSARKVLPMNNVTSRLTAPLVLLAAVALAGPVHAQEPAPTDTLYVHGFRSPSIGLEYRRNDLGLHAGLYTTILNSGGDSTEFIKTGLTHYFRLGKNRRREFYVGASYLRGLNRDYDNRNAVMLEQGTVFTLGKRFELRLGGGLLAAEGRKTKLNPTIGISWAVPLR